MKTKIIIAGILIAWLSLVVTAQGQEKRLGIELSGGPSIGLKALSGSDLNIGGGFEGVFHYRLMKHTGLYAGWGWNHFSANESFAGNDTGFEETGYVMGLQFKHPIGTSPVKYFFRAGALYNHIELENPEGEIISDTHHGWGWQLAGGIDLPMGQKWHFTPGLKMNNLSRPLAFNQTDHQLDLRYLSFRVGFLYDF